MAKHKATRLTKARERLRVAIDRACIARGEAQWTNGFRGGSRFKESNTAEDERLYRKEMGQFKYCEVVEAQVERALTALLRTCR